MGYNGKIGNVGLVGVHRLDDEMIKMIPGTVYLSSPDKDKNMFVIKLTVVECAGLGAMLTTVAEQMVAYQKGGVK